MYLKRIVLILIGVSSGGVIAAGVFAFLAIIGVFARLIDWSQTKENIWIYETAIILGGVLGNLTNLYEIPQLFGGRILLIIWGLSMGIFVGCLVMSLAETLKALPVFCRRVKLAFGLPYLITAIAIGKFTGSMIYFWKGFGRT